MVTVQTWKLRKCELGKPRWYVGRRSFIYRIQFLFQFDSHFLFSGLLWWSWLDFLCDSRMLCVSSL